MSNEELMQKVAGMLRPAVKDAAREEVGLRMKDLSGIVQKEMEGLPGIVRQEMDACLDGKCDVIADRLVGKLPKAEASVMTVEDITKAVKEAMVVHFKQRFQLDLADWSIDKAMKCIS